MTWFPLPFCRDSLCYDYEQKACIRVPKVIVAQSSECRQDSNSVNAVQVEYDSRTSLWAQ